MNAAGGCVMLLIVGMWSACALALDLDFLRDTPITYLTETDKVLQRDAALYVLEHTESDATREWSNPLTGFTGRIEGKGDWISADGQRCRKIKLVAQAKGAESVFVLPLCKDAAGEWFIGSGLKLSPSKDSGRVAAASI
jgi:hypothetical protein